MKSRAILSHRIMFAVLAVACAACAARAQQATKPAGKESPQIESELRSGGNFHSSFASSEFASDGTTIVKGSPFSAVVIKETTQILSDGRRIPRRMVASVYRDSEGRTRNEWGNERKSQGAAPVPIIYDVVTGTLYFGGRALESKAPVKDNPRRKARVVTPDSPPDDVTRVLGETIELLGTKTIEGVEADGVRVTTTIPAAEANGRASNKVYYERWYSQQLRRNVLIKVTDPRFGEAVYRMTNIERTEPARELFQVSAPPPAPASTSTIAPPKLEAGAPVSIKLERGGHVSVDNRTTGRIRIIGWDRDTIEATATSERGPEAVRFATSNKNDQYIWLKADYLKREDEATPPQPPGATRSDATTTATSAAASTDEPKLPAPAVDPVKPVPPAGELRLMDLIRRSVNEKLGKTEPFPGGDKDDDEPPMRDGRPIEVHLEVRVPRYAEIELIKVIRSRVEISGVDSPVVVLGDRSDVILKNVRGAEVRTRSGAVDVEGASGFVEVVTTSGPVRVERAEGDVRVLSISGKIEIGCVSGRVNVDSADGSVALSNVKGDVEANSSNSDVTFRGAIREDGRYHLKTMSGAIEMAVRDKAPGFTAALSSYRGTIENDFQLQINQSNEQHREGDLNRRIIGRHGDGQAQITLDSFDGRVRLAHITHEAVRECKIQN